MLQNKATSALLFSAFVIGGYESLKLLTTNEQPDSLLAIDVIQPSIKADVQTTKTAFERFRRTILDVQREQQYFIDNYSSHGNDKESIRILQNMAQALDTGSTFIAIDGVFGRETARSKKSLENTFRTGSLEMRGSRIILSRVYLTQFVRSVLGSEKNIFENDLSPREKANSLPDSAVASLAQTILIGGEIKSGDSGLKVGLFQIIAGLLGDPVKVDGTMGADSELSIAKLRKKFSLAPGPGVVDKELAYKMSDALVGEEHPATNQE